MMRPRQVRLGAEPTSARRAAPEAPKRLCARRDLSGVDASRIAASRRLARKGMSMESALVTLVIFGAVFLVLVLIFKNLLSTSERAFTDEECRASLLLTRALDKPLSAACIKPVDNPVPLKCSRRFITASPDRIVDTSGKKLVDVTLAHPGSCPSGITSCLEQRALADEMRHCWSVFFNGEVPVFQQVDKFLDIGDNEIGCFVCSEVTVRDGFTGFVSYLKSAQVPVTGRVADGTTYFDEIAGNPKAFCNAQRTKSSPTCWESFSKPYDGNAQLISWITKDLPAIEQDSFAPGTYAVVFMREGMEQDCGRSDTGVDSPSFTVQAIPLERMHEYCPTVMG